MSHSCRRLQDNNAKGNEDRTGLAHEVSEADKDSVRKWVMENLSWPIFWPRFCLHSVPTPRTWAKLN